jgi:ribosome biogenesis protein SSF1/2
VSTKSVGLSRTVRKTDANTSALPNLGKFEDVADFVLSGDGYDSASEVDEDEKVEVRAPSMVQETTGTQQRAVKLTEIGPRLRLELVKIEEGMCDGQVLYHRYVQKTKVHLALGTELIEARGERTPSETQSESGREGSKATRTRGKCCAKEGRERSQNSEWR